LNNSLNRNPVPVAALWMLGTVFSLSSIAISVRELGDDMSPFEMVFFRSLIGLMILTPIVLYQQKRLPCTTQLTDHIIRNVTHYLGQSAWFYGITIISLAKVFAIEFTTPMWTLVLATFLLGEKMTRWRIIAIVFGLVGVLIVLRPGLIPIHFASIVVLAGSFGFAMSHIYTRKLAQLESPTVILFYMSAIQVPLALLPALNNWVMPMGMAWTWIFVIGIASITAHYCLSRALTIADASIIIPLDFLRLPLIVLVGYLFYQEALDWYVLLGASIIFIGNTLNLRKEYHGANR
jgi:drug/metabolite transporter (DMT)-like permease